VTLSKLIISAIAHLHTVGLKGFVTLLGEKGFPPPNGFTLIMASLRSAGQRVSEAYSRLKISASGRNGEGAARCPSCSQNAHDKNVLVRRAHSRINQATLEKEVRDWEDTRSGRPSSPPSREKIEARGYSTCAVEDNPDHLLKTVGGKWRSGTGTAANGGASPLVSDCPSHLASARFRDEPS